MMARDEYTQVEIDALPEFKIGGDLYAFTDPLTGSTSMVRKPQKFLLQKDAGFCKDGRGMVWMIFTDQDGKTWKQATL